MTQQDHAKAAIGQKPNAAFSDPIPMVTEAIVDCKMADGTRQRYVITGPMRASLSTDVRITGRTINFHFQDPVTVQQVNMDAPPHVTYPPGSMPTNDDGTPA